DECTGSHLCLEDLEDRFGSGCLIDFDGGLTTAQICISTTDQNYRSPRYRYLLRCIVWWRTAFLYWKDGRLETIRGAIDLPHNRTCDQSSTRFAGPHDLVEGKHSTTSRDDFVSY